MPFLRSLILPLILALPASAAEKPSRSIRIALIENNRAHLSMNLAQPLERIIRDQEGRAAILSVKSVPSEYSKGAYGFRTRSKIPAQDRWAAYLDTGDEIALVFPPDRDFVRLLKEAAADPATYRRPWSLELSEKKGWIDQRAEGDETVVTIATEDNAPGMKWKKTMSTLYRIRWRDKELSVLLSGPVFGGIARLKTVIERERRKGPFLGLARDGIFGGWEVSELQGLQLAEALEGMGLRYSAVAHSEFRLWEEFKIYREIHPKGIQFLSANLVYSSAPATTYFPGTALFEHDGLTIGIIGLTPSSVSKYLAPAGLGHLTLADPVKTVYALLPGLRKKADMIILLIDLNEDTSPIARRLRGVDIILAGDARAAHHKATPPTTRLSRPGYRAYSRPLWTMRAYHAAMSMLEVRIEGVGRGSTWHVHEYHIPLDDSVPDAPDLPAYDPSFFGIAFDSTKPLIPSPRKIFPAGSRRDGYTRIGPRDFWSLGAGLLAEKTGAEAALVRVWPLGVRVDDDIPKGIVKTWLRTKDPAVIVRMRGSRLKEFILEAQRQKDREWKGLPAGSKIRFTAGGVGPQQTIHGLQIDPSAAYKVATTLVMAETYDLPNPKLIGHTIDDIVMEGLTERSGAAPEDYKRWMEGLPVRERGLWQVDFRDISLRLSQTKVVRDNAFDAVPDSRVQGLDELLAGFILKTNVDYLESRFKWGNSLHLEYAQSRIQPRNKPAVVNTAADHIDLLTRGTLRKGSFPYTWFARDWGPALGFEFQSQFRTKPGLKRKEIYSIHPGVEFYNGSIVKSFVTSLSIKRDRSGSSPNNQYGLRTRLVADKNLGMIPGSKIQGDFYAKYFILTTRDRAQDLRLEVNAKVKVHFPLWKNLTLAPFLDVYYFGLKTRPIFGYNIKTGISLGFSRLWKPQYEDF